MEEKSEALRRELLTRLIQEAPNEPKPVFKELPPEGKKQIEIADPISPYEMISVLIDTDPDDEFLAGLQREHRKLSLKLLALNKVTILYKET